MMRKPIMENTYRIAVADKYGNIFAEATKMRKDELNLLLNAWLEFEPFQDYHFIVEKEEQ